MQKQLELVAHTTGFQVQDEYGKVAGSWIGNTTSCNIYMEQKMNFKDAVIELRATYSDISLRDAFSIIRAAKAVVVDGYRLKRI